MHALHAVRTAPVRAAVRLQTMRTSEDAGMTTAEYAVGTMVGRGHALRPGNNHVSPYAATKYLS